MTFICKGVIRCQHEEKSTERLRIESVVYESNLKDAYSKFFDKLQACCDSLKPFGNKIDFEVTKVESTLD